MTATELNLTGTIWGRLTVLKQVGKDKYGQSMWACVCECGAERTVRSWPLRSGKTKSCGCFQSDVASKPRKTVVTYATTHRRLKKLKGPARNYACVDCSTTAAAEWSYDNLDPNELTSPTGHYSLDFDHYVPRCTKCHSAFDALFRPRATTCVQGHPYDEVNTYWRPDGQRDCRECTRAAGRRYNQRQRATA